MKELLPKVSLSGLQELLDLMKLAHKASIKSWIVSYLSYTEEVMLK
jgi:hypothetical protein